VVGDRRDLVSRRPIGRDDLGIRLRAVGDPAPRLAMRVKVRAAPAAVDLLVGIPEMRARKSGCLWKVIHGRCYVRKQDRDDEDADETNEQAQRFSPSVTRRTIHAAFMRFTLESRAVITTLYREELAATMRGRFAWLGAGVV